MRWILVILYIVCFGCYILFTRQPDYFDSQFTTGKIITQDEKLVAIYSDGNNRSYAELPYQFLYHDGQAVKIIYESSDPSKAKPYHFIGYWITAGELIASLVIVGVLYFVAVSITSNPTPEALIEEMEMGKKKPKKPKYDL